MIRKNRNIKREAVIPSLFNDLATMLYSNIHLLIFIHTVYREVFQFSQEKK